MKRKLIVMIALVTIAVPAICSATPVRPGPYVSGFIGVSAFSNTDATTNDFLAVPVATVNDRIEFDPSINIGGTGGFDFGYVRLEGELSYKHGEITTVTEQNTGTRFVSADGSLGALAFLANAFFDLHNETPVTPYFGGGIGFAALHLSNTTGFNTTTRQIETVYSKDDDTVFAYQAGGGLEIALNRRFSLDLGYRYFATSRARFENDPTLTTSLKLESHTGAVGFRVKF